MTSQHDNRREQDGNPFGFVHEFIFVVRVERFKTATKGGDGSSDAHSALETAFAYILPDDDAFSRDRVRQQILPGRARAGNAQRQAASRIIFTAQKRGDQAEKATDGKEDGREQGRPHDDIDDGDAPPTRFAVNAANVEDEAHDTVYDRDEGDDGQNSARRTAAEHTPDRRDDERRTEEYRRIHDALAIAADVVLVGHFQADE